MHYVRFIPQTEKMLLHLEDPALAMPQQKNWKVA